jgi:hypothetical protein
MFRKNNEFNHVVSAQLRAILEGNEARYPDGVFFDILVEQTCMSGYGAKVGGLLKHLYTQSQDQIRPTS